MEKYYKVEFVGVSEVDKYLRGGWVIINTTKDVYEDGNEVLRYHLGYPIEKQLEDAMSLIKSYEDNGLHEELFKKIAEANGLNVEDYDTFPGGVSETNILTIFMEKYDLVSLNRAHKYYRKKTQEELDTMGTGL